MYKVMRHQTFKAVCFLNISFDLNITAAIQIVTKKPAHKTILPLVGTPNNFATKKRVIERIITKNNRVTWITDHSS
jgi:hypothetical protein